MPPLPRCSGFVAFFLLLSIWICVTYPSHRYIFFPYFECQKFTPDTECRPFHTFLCSVCFQFLELNFCFQSSFCIFYKILCNCFVILPGTACLVYCKLVDALGSVFLHIFFDGFTCGLVLRLYNCLH